MTTTTLAATAITVREARAEDDAVVGELLVEAFVTAYAEKMPWVVVTDERKAELRAVAAKRQVARVFVADVPGAGVVGTVSIFPAGAPGSEAWLEGAADLRHLAVSPRHTGRGISTVLMDRAEAEAWALGSTAICLHVRRGAHGIARFYEARGYRRAVEGDFARPTVELDGYVLRRRAP